MVALLFFLCLPLCGEAEILESTNIFIQLESLYLGPNKLYVGQEFEVGYRFTFYDHLDLSKEYLPLLSGEGFRKIGGKLSDERTQGQMTTVQITQRMQAIKVGRYPFEGGVIEGRLYRMDPYGRKQFSKKSYRTESAPLEIQVLSFPEEGRPEFFDGAVGDFKITSLLLSPSTLNVREQLILEVKVLGQGDLSSISAPELCCIPDFSGFFKLSDLPPMIHIEGNAKIFTFRLRPLSDRIQEIPPIPFAFFDPTQQKYVERSSAPIPITVMQTNGALNEGGEEFAIEQNIPGLIEIESLIPLSFGDLKNRFFGTFWTLFILPIALFLFFLQWNLKKGYKVALKQQKKLSPKAFLEKVFLLETTPLFFQGIEEALKMQLEEKGGDGKKIAAYFQGIERERFGKEPLRDRQQIEREVRALFEEME